MAADVVFSDVWKTYEKELGGDSHPALKGVSFEVQTGETVGLIGANGAGKSTCIRLLMDFIRPDKGQISLNGKSVNDSSLRHDIGYLPEVPSFPANLNILDMLRFVAKTHSLEKVEFKEQAEHWLNALGLWDARKKPIRSYSKGMQQRAGFVLALVHDPSFLSLDEPMSGLDPIGRDQIGKIVFDLKSRGKTILFCSHILEDVDRLVDRLLILHKGEKRFDGTLQELAQEYQVETIVDGFLRAIGEVQG
jgi:ABC-2 type transport system ATP-binding protein